MTDDFDGYAGIDWASETHHACVVDGAGQWMGERDVSHGGSGLAELCAWLVTTTGASPDRLAVAIETSHGPVVEMLLERGFAVHAINPKQLDRFRDRFTMAGAKDDSRDAYVLAHALVTDRQAYRRLMRDDPLIIELREWSRLADDLRDEHTRLANRMREQLWRYYPQMLELVDDDIAANWLLELWEEAPTPTKAAQTSVGAIARILKAHRIQRFDAAEALRILRQKPLVVASGTIQAASGHIRILIQRIRLVNQQRKQAHRKLDGLCRALEQQPGGDEASNRPEQRDVTILRSLPGIGRINLATLLAEACEALKRRDYHVLRALSGQAPVTRRSGKKCIVLRRYACNRRLANAVYHWSRVATQHDPISRARYAALRQRGHSHGRALRTVGDRLLALACTLLERQVLFDPHHHDKDQAAAA